MKAGLVQYPLLLSTPMSGAAKVVGKAKGAYAGCSRGDWRLLVPSQPAGSTLRGRTPLAGLNGTGGGSQVPACSVDNSTALSHVTTAWETLQIILTLHLPRSSIISLSLLTTRWMSPCPGSRWGYDRAGTGAQTIKFPLHYLENSFLTYLANFFFFKWKISIICNKKENSTLKFLCLSSSYISYQHSTILHLSIPSPCVFTAIF